MYHWLAKKDDNPPQKKQKKNKKTCHRTNFEANLRPEPGDFFLLAS